MEMKPLETLKKERLRRGLSQVEVARRAKINRVDLCLLEKGGRPAFPSWRRRLAKVFRMPQSKLFPEIFCDGEDEA
jgi:transcriptional regulator with XRE-family HTH domain